MSTVLSEEDEEEVFELELVGGASERRYRSSRPEVAAMPWGTLDVSALAPLARDEARRMWTAASFQEHRTGAHCSQALLALFACRAPVDLIAGFSRFPLDEIVHTELAARMANELGGPIEVRYTQHDVIREPAPGPPLLRAAELVVKTFCVGESLSIPLLHASWKAATQPLAQAVLGRIVQDEAAHGILGWTFLDWAAPYFDDADRARLGHNADEALGEILKLWTNIRTRSKGDASAPNGIGWLGDDVYLALAARSLATRVITPLLARRIPVDTGVLPEEVRACLGG